MHRRRVQAARTATAVLLAAALAGCTSSPPPPVATTTGTVGASTVIASPPPAGTTVQPARTTAPTRPAGAAPAVTGLAWLDGQPDDPGVTVKRPDGRTRWQGSTPGQYALVSTDGFSWFGADGSMVGCVSGDRCVGIDAAGYTAVVTAADRMRLVYGPDGMFVGRFDRAGRPLTGGGPTLSSALAETGVDVAALIDEAGRPVPFAGGVTGDPHLITIGGTRLTTQLTGEFQARAGDPDRPIQLRFEPMAHRKDVSVVTAVALLVDGTRVQFSGAGALTVGEEVMPDTEPFRSVELGGGAAVGVWRPTADRATRSAVVWPDGATVSMVADPALGMTVIASLPGRPGLGGLFGTGVGTDDLRDRRGLTGSDDTIVGSWQLGSQETALFTERVAPVPGFPEEPAEVPPAAAAQAERACTAAGVQAPADRAACAFDVGLTGDDGFAVGHGELAALAERQLYPPGLADRWPALTAGFTGSPQTVPQDGRVAVTLAAGDHLVYRLDVTQAGEVGVRHTTDCAEPQAHPGAGEAAARVFDSSDRPVSARWPMCGHSTSGPLQPGRYALVLDGPRTGPSVPVELSVELP